MACKRDTLQKVNSTLFSFWIEKYLQWILYNYYFLLLAGSQKISCINLFSLIFFWAGTNGPSHTLQFPPGSLLHLLSHLPFHWKRWLETPPSVFFFFFFPSERTHILGMQRQRCGSSDASQLPWPRSRIPSRIYGTLKCERLKCHLVTVYRWGRDRAQWLLDVFLPLPSGKLWITTKGIS